MFESKKRAFLFLALSILFALSAVFLFYSHVETMEQELGQMVDVQTAAQDIPVGTPIAPEMLKPLPLPKKYVVDSFVTSPDEVKGKVSLVPIPRGEVLTNPMLREMAKMPNGYRLVQLRAPIAVFDDEVEVLDRVDVIGTYERKAGDESRFQQVLPDQSDWIHGDTRATEMILRDVQVIRVYKQEEEIVAVGVALTLEQAEQIVWLQNFGKEVRVLKANHHLPGGGS
ncbi:MAG: hypothetical protein H0Z34_17615 [Brevibacillus sp.]|nr:hypothetical protein [Brevibacillus sp.]